MLSHSVVQAYSGGQPITAQEKHGGTEGRRDADLRARVEALIIPLSKAQPLADSSELDARVQLEFRHALEHIRRTASLVQQWFEARAKSGDPYAVLPILATQRVRRATQLAKDLSLDLESMDVTVETEGLQDLYQTIGRLHRQLDVLCKRAK